MQVLGKIWKKAALAVTTVALAAGLAPAAALAVTSADDGAQLAPATLTAQTSGNRTAGTAQAVTLGKSTTVSYDKLDGLLSAHYWYKFRTTNRNSVYTVKVESVDGSQVSVALFDSNITQTSFHTITSDNPTQTFTHKIESSSDKGTWNYVKLTCKKRFVNYGDRFRITVTEHPVLKQVAGVKATKTTKSAITMKWNLQPYATKYQVKYREWGESWKTLNVKYTVNSYKFTKLKSNTKYQFKVRAYRKGGWSATADKTSNWGGWSITKSVKTAK